MIGFLAVHLRLDFFPDGWGSIIVEHDWPSLLPKSSSFNDIATLDLKEFASRYVFWMVDSFSRFIQGKLISNKKANTIISDPADTGLHGFQISH